MSGSIKHNQLPQRNFSSFQKRFFFGMVGPKEKSIRVSGLKFLEGGKISPGELVMLD